MARNYSLNNKRTKLNALFLLYDLQGTTYNWLQNVLGILTLSLSGEIKAKK